MDTIPHTCAVPDQDIPTCTRQGQPRIVGPPGSTMNGGMKPATLPDEFLLPTALGRSLQQSSGLTYSVSPGLCDFGTLSFSWVKAQGLEQLGLGSAVEVVESFQ
jgi:hypothetical protein